MSKWYEFDPQVESLRECHSRRLMQCPILSPQALESLQQLRVTVWDGNLLSKEHRDELVCMGLAVKFNGWQVISAEGIAVLETLGMMHNREWAVNR